MDCERKRRREGGGGGRGGGDSGVTCVAATGTSDVYPVTV